MAIQNAWIKVGWVILYWYLVVADSVPSFLSLLSDQPFKCTWTSTFCGRLIRRTRWTSGYPGSGRRISDVACPAAERSRRRVRSTLTVSIVGDLIRQLKLICDCRPILWLGVAGDDDDDASNDDDDPGYELLFYARNGASILLVNGDYVLKYDKLLASKRRRTYKLPGLIPKFSHPVLYNPLD